MKVNSWLVGCFRENFNTCSLLSLLFMLVSACKPAPTDLAESHTNKENTNGLQVTSGQPVRQGTPIRLPQDHGAHLEQGIEWWYVTANLTSDSGETFGVQWTLFRTLMPSVSRQSQVIQSQEIDVNNSAQAKIDSQWWDENLYFSHFAMQHQQQHFAFERFARAKQAEIISEPFVAKIDDWQLASTSTSFLPLVLTANAKQDGEQYQVQLTLANSPITLHGDKGYSQKTESGHASMYFSYPFLEVSGELVFAGKKHQVSGNAWYDREWSASLIDRNQLGWDWFSLVTDKNVAEDSDEKQNNQDNRGLMVFCIRGNGKKSRQVDHQKGYSKEQQIDNSGYDYCSGSQISANGDNQQISGRGIDIRALASVELGGKQYPSKWRLTIADQAPIIIETVTKDARNELSIPYWEGRVTASGGFKGNGYAELTGY